MKNLLLLSLFLTTTLKAQINIGNIFNTDLANQMNVNWRCSSETYPNVNQLPNAEVISFKVKNNGKIKISPNIFNDDIKPKKILKILGIKKDDGPEKQAVSVESSECFNGLYAALKTQFAQNTKDCATKDSNICKLTEASFIEAIDEQIKNSDYAKKTKDSHKLPRILAFNNANAVDYQTFSNQINGFCAGKEGDYDKDLILTGGFLKQVNSYAKYTNSQPNIECIDKLKAELAKYSDKIIADNCQASAEVCEFLKGEKQTVDLSFDEIRKIRAIEVDKKEAEYRTKLNSDWEKEYEANFKSMIDNGKSDTCGDFTTGISNDNKTKYMNPVTMTKLVTKNMDSLFAKMSAKCQQQFIRQYIEQNTFDTVVQDGYNYRTFCEKNKAKICDENRQYTVDIEKNIERMLELAYGEYGKDYFREQLLACEKENLNDLNSLLSKLKTFDKKMTCAPLKPGDAKVVSSTPTGINADYALKQTGQNETTAIVNMKFTAEVGATVSGKQMEDRVKGCMDNVSPYLKGGNGEQLKIKIVNPDEAAALPSNQRPTVNSVDVAAGSIRSNSRRYDPSVDCTVITHEVMHLLGLCDEYKEQWTGVYYDVATGQTVNNGTQEKVNDGTQKFVTSYNCRNVPPIPSIMKSQNEVFDRAVPKSVSCECAGKMCKDYMGASEPLQKLFQNYGWDVIDNYYKQKFCKSKTRPDITKAKYVENPKQFTLLAETTDAKISYNFKYAAVDSVKSVDMNCDCNNPLGYSEQSDIDTCKAIVGQIAKSIAEDVPPKDNRTCPPGTEEKDVKWGGDPNVANSFNGSSYKVFKARREPAMASVLYPEQFNRIVGGACDEVTPLYNQCSRLAYKTVMDENACNIPPECKDMSKLMGIPK